MHIINEAGRTSQGNTALGKKIGKTNYYNIIYLHKTTHEKNSNTERREKKKTKSSLV